ncbi:2OG-Fe(II) oxygenase family protein [Salinarimonas chemoclinalis]|uniref:2OG-Fe(II) oxygenase family protein n=1 Tax=Salinarimonas chemoclinalis TaxID=3241599 RepID=UPI003558552C
MSTTPASGVPRIERGAIYRDIYERRADDRPATGRADLVRARIEGDALVFDDGDSADRALHDGVFALAIPAALDLDPGDRFAAQFHEGFGARPYGCFRSVRSDVFGDPLLGFHERTNQIEQFLLERRFWASHYPAEIAALGEALTRLSGIVLRSVLARVGLPRSLWTRATGGCAALAGSYHLTFNHYRPAVEGIGLASHKDDGFLTILRTTSEGLEVNRAGAWERVAPDPRCFIVNFGLSMEMLTKGCAVPVAAIMHRVAHQAVDRSSFGHFTSSACGPGRAVDVFTYLDDGLHRVCDARELIDANDHEIYAGTRPPEEAP